MNRSRPAFLASALLLVAASIAATTGAAEKPPKRVLVSVSSRVDDSYKRTKLPDGSFKPELYAISNGGMVAGTMRDAAQESMDVSIIAKAVAVHQAEQKYFLAPDTKSAELLLVVQWGRTIPFNDVNYSARVGLAGDAMSQAQNLSRSAAPQRAASSPEEAAAAQAESSAQIQAQIQANDAMNDQLFAMQIENDVRDQRNLLNAQVLGYLDAVNDADGIQRYAGGGNRYDDLRGDIEEARYYIIISAYDFKSLAGKKDRQLRWVTRISIRAQGNRFGERVNEMIARASRYFGADSGKLVREYEGTVEMGEPEVVGIVDEPESDAPPAPQTPAGAGTADQPR